MRNSEHQKKSAKDLIYNQEKIKNEARKIGLFKFIELEEKWDSYENRVYDLSKCIAILLIICGVVYNIYIYPRSIKYFCNNIFIEINEVIDDIIIFVVIAGDIYVTILCIYLIIYYYYKNKMKTLARRVFKNLGMEVPKVWTYCTDINGNWTSWEKL